MNDQNGNLHQSHSWLKPHVDLGRDHGHSPTINPPRSTGGTIEIGGREHLPPPFGPTPGPGDFFGRK